MRRALIIAILVVAAGAAVLLVRPDIVGMGTPGATPSTTPVPSVASSTDVVAEARAIPIRTASLGVSVSGTVTKVVALGAKVAKGDTLIALDTSIADAQLVGAQAALNAATAQRDQANAGVTQAAAAITLAQAGVTQAQAGVDQANAAVTQAKAAVAQAKAGVNQATAARDILPGAASNAQKRQANAVVDGAQAQLDNANAGVTAANAAVDAAQAALAQARAQVQSATAAKAVADATAKAAEAERVRASSAVDVAQHTRDLYVTTAPFDGIVSSVLIHEGELLGPGVAVVRIADTSGWTFETTDLAEAGAARIAPGDTATITVEDVESVQIQGRVRQIAVYGEDRQGDVVFRVVVEPTTTVPSPILWNTVVTVTIHADPALRGAGAAP